ncbi:unnamed protein product [Phytophthora fragariaefolia]|uniref:Unnamed protein product n=1 Tax=Phytophthora fragariaefolia TaxID=1490495 RepID=A0A9W6Y7X3_9STRA|nr:unnamed protein product [Phytophthora fragariaefolia]
MLGLFSISGLLATMLVVVGYSGRLTNGQPVTQLHLHPVNAHRILSTTAYSCTTRSDDNNLGAATELGERTGAECPASTRNGAACWTIGDISGIITELDAVLAFQRTLAGASVHAQHTVVLSDAPWPIDRPGTTRPINWLGDLGRLGSVDSTNRPLAE